MRPISFLAFSFCSLIPISAMASEAAFSADGKTLRVISFGSPTLLSFKTGEATPIKTPLPKALAGENGASHILTDPKGLLVTANGKLWLWNPGQAETAPTIVAPLPFQFDVRGISRSGDSILINGYHTFDASKKPKDVEESTSFYGWKPGKKKFEAVFIRRIEHVTACPVFAGERMIFGGDHDVWEGGFEGGDDGMEGRFDTLYGHRIAPLALMNTDGSNSGGMSVRSLAIAGDTIWASLGGRHMGALASMPLPNKPGSDEHPELADSWKIQADQLARTKSVILPGAEGGEASDITESIDALCSWNGPDGAWKVAFRSDYKTFWIIEKDATVPKKIGADLPREQE